MSPLLSEGWAFLPRDLLGLILDRIEVWRDYVRCGAVCRPWLSAALDRQQPSNRVPVPLLLIPTKDRSRERRGLYSVKRDKVLKGWEVGVPNNSLRCCGSSHGWLATAEEDLRITLLNPFSGKTIHLPPLTCSSSSTEKPQYKIRKVVLSADPGLNPNDFVVVAIYSAFKELAYFKSGQNNNDSCWTYIGKELFVKPAKKSWTYIDGRLFSDAIFHGGKLYVVDHRSGLISVDYSGLKPEVRVIVQRPSILSRADHLSNYAFLAYIVESSSGADLLLVQRDYHEHGTSNFKIFKLSDPQDDLSQHLPRRWVEIDSLGNDALFLGDNYSLAVAVPAGAAAAASSGTLVKPNCIYYTDNYVDLPYEFESRGGPRDMGIYWLEDGSISRHYQMKARHRRMPPAIWIVPPMLRGTYHYGGNTYGDGRIN